MEKHTTSNIKDLVKGLNEKIRGWTNYYNIPKVCNTSESFSSLSYYIATKLERYFYRKSQRRCKLGNQKAFKVLVGKCGLIDPSKASKMATVNA